MSRPNWKQITFVGYYMNSQNMIDFIDIAKNNGITHILLEFITLGVNNDWSSGLKFVDTVSNWINDFTDTDRNNILNKLNESNITLGLSMGGATSFNGDFSSTWTNQISPYYIDGTNITNIESSATKFGIDLANIAKNCGLSYIDLDIEHIPTVSTYQNYDDISNYLGYLSKAIKENLNNGIVSHSPQSPYLYPYINGNWRNLYYIIEQNFGNYIDWYNIQYYNQGTYNQESQVFTNDNYYSASVYQLQIANNVQGLTPFPPKKIVVGGGTDSGSGLCKNTSNITGPSWSTLTTWIENQKYTNNEWFNNGGIMTWIYGINSTMGYNNELITFWKNTNNLNMNIYTNSRQVYDSFNLQEKNDINDICEMCNLCKIS